MISTETISTKINMLPTSSQKEVLDFIDDLLEKSAKSNQKEKAAAWEDWEKVILKIPRLSTTAAKLFTRTNKTWKIFKPTQIFFCEVPNLPTQLTNKPLMPSKVYCQTATEFV